LKDGAIPENPYAHLFLGRSLLLQGRLPEAQAAYLDAISAASRDNSTAFHVRFLYVNDLYTAGKYQLAQCGEGPICESLVSPYPLERAFGIYETLMYAWSVGDTAEIARLTAELERVVPEARARPDSPFEIRRIKEAQNFLRRIKAAQAGDDYTAMILDEEAGWFDRLSSNYLSIRNRLQKWVTKHPISDYTQLKDEEQRFALQSTHCAYICAAARAASPEVADEMTEQGFRSLIENIPVDEKTKGWVISWHLSLASCLENQKRFREEMEVLQRARDLITPGTLSHRSLLLQTDHVTQKLQATGESSR
jgi:tetratricopeptide (TPR) repeat protein